MKSIKETVSSFAIRQALNYARKDPGQKPDESPEPVREGRHQKGKPRYI